MVIERILSTIGVMILSMALGVVAYYFLSDLEKEQKKKEIEENISMIVNFVIYLWISKLLLKVKLLFADPFAALAFPSTSQAFYMATLLVSLHIIYKVKLQKMNMTQFMLSFVPIFLAASFVYEFIQIVILQKGYSLFYLILLSALLLLYVLRKEMYSREKITKILVIGWGVGSVIISLILPYVTIFGYRIDSLYLLALFIISLLWVFSMKEKSA